MFEKITSLDIINTLLTISFTSSFIGIFFFTYVKNIEKDIIVNNIKYLVTDTISNYIHLLSPDDKKKINDYEEIK